MKGVELMVLLIGSAGGVGVFILHAVKKMKDDVRTLKARFIGGPLDKQEKMLKRYPDRYAYKDIDGDPVIYKHEGSGIYTFVE